MKNEVLAMEIDLVAFAIENGVTMLPTGQTPIEVLRRIAQSLREEEPKRKYSRREEQPVA